MVQGRHYRTTVSLQLSGFYASCGHQAAGARLVDPMTQTESSSAPASAWLSCRSLLDQPPPCPRPAPPRRPPPCCLCPLQRSPCPASAQGWCCQAQMGVAWPRASYSGACRAAHAAARLRVPRARWPAAAGVRARDVDWPACLGAQSLSHCLYPRCCWPAPAPALLAASPKGEDPPVAATPVGRPTS